MTPFFKETFGDTIRTLREKRGLRLREVADELEIGISMLAKIETNNRKPTRKLIEGFSRFFEVKEKDLMIAFISDTVAYEVIEEQDFANEILKVAEIKVNHRRKRTRV